MNRSKLFKCAFMAVVMNMLCVMAFAQSRSVKGTVIDDTGEPLTGVNVVEKGTTNGVTTDIDGGFILSLSDASVLVVSYIGYAPQEVVVGSRTEINITLSEDTQFLEEVVVVGYGTMRKSDLTGSVGSVSSDKIASMGTSSVMGALQGSTPGVDISTNSTRPGGGFNIEVRGQNSIQSGKPLYVVDGIVTDDIDFLNPSDIERIDILKDASSTAIYGSRGSNGVIIVQTKGARSATSRLSVSYDGYYGVREIARIPDFMDGREWTDYRTSRYYTWNATAQAYELTDANRNAITQNSPLVNNALYNENYEDWLSLGTKSGSQQNHYVNISGMGADISYNIGVGVQTEEGNFLEEEMKRYVFKGSVDHKANRFFSTGASFTLAHQNINTGSQYGYRDLLRIPNVLGAYDSEGALIEQPGIKEVIDGDGNFTSAANPLIEISSGLNETRRFDILGSVYAQLTPIEGLSIKTTMSPRLNRTRNGYYYEKNANRTYNQAQNDNQETYEWTWDNVANYTKTFNDVHNVNVTLIHSVYQSEYENLRVWAQNFPYNSQWYNMFNGDLTVGNCQSGYRKMSLISYAARANYDYAGKYMVTGTVRYDGSSKLADKWSAFPSAALAWRLSEEGFMENTRDWLNSLKMRLSFGYSGNNNGVNAYGTQLRPNTSANVFYDFGGNVYSGFATGQPVNTSLTWERTREWNLGFDFSLFRGRVSGGIDIYDKLSKDLLMARTLTIESGVKEMTDNVGSVNNRGVEVSLSTVNVSTKDLEWRTTFTFAHNKNAIRELYGKKMDVVGESRFIGQPINVTYDYKIDGVYSLAEWNNMSNAERTAMGAIMPGYAKAIDTNNDGRMSEDDKIILGTQNPDWTGSFTSTLTYKNFDFTFNIYTRQGVYVNDYFLQEFSPSGNNQRGRPKVNMDYYVPGGVPRIDYNNFTSDANGNHWVTWGTSTEVAGNVEPVNGMTGAFYGSNGYYQDASFIKVRNITLGYTFDSNLVKKIKLASARVYVNVLNPFTITDYIGWDPEFARTTLQNGNGPSTITYQIGANLKF